MSTVYKVLLIAGLTLVVIAAAAALTPGGMP